MSRRVFYSFDYERDCWRASMVRNIGVVEGNQAARDNSWESVNRDDAAAIMRWIDNELNGRSCTIVLIGAETANSRWVNYEIERSLSSGKAMFGIRIHRLLDQNQQESLAGPDPFANHTLPDGRPLSAIIPSYDPTGASSKEVYAHISEQLEQWIEAAIANRQR